MSLPQQNWAWLMYLLVFFWSEEACQVKKYIRSKKRRKVN
jgi:hypothetical protein